MIFIGADHKGFSLKEKIKLFLDDISVEYKDLGAHHLNPSNDYTFVAEVVARAVSQENGAKGILLCGSGVGVDIVANKIDGARSGLAKSAEQIISARRDDNINILVLAADFTNTDEAKSIIKAFLETDFDHLPRHQKRLDDIKKIEETN